MNLVGASIWYLQQADRAVKRPGLDPKTRETLQKRIDDIKTDMDKQYRWLPLKDVPLAHMEETGIQPFYNEWLSHAGEPWYWTDMKLPAPIRNIKVPVLLLTFWYDHLAKDMLDAYHELKNHGTRIVQDNLHLPKHDRNMNTGHAIGEDAEGIVAHQTIYHDAEHPSYIMMPIQPVSE